MLQIAICDKEQSALIHLRTLLEKALQKYAIHYNIVSYESGEELLDSHLIFHLIFLEIKLEGRDGIEIGKILCRRNRSAKIIFHTNLIEYCHDAINKTHAFGFLKKPVEESVIEEQMLEFFESQDSVPEVWMEFKQIKGLDSNNQEREFLKLPVKDIIYFEYQKRERNIKATTVNGEFFFSETMNVLEGKMKPYGFEISCRGILVNLGKVKRIKRYTLEMHSGELINLSQKRVEYFRERLNEFARKFYK